MINVVCAVIQDERKRLLVCQRPTGKAHAGKWEFPGGKIETGENPEDALRREIFEELGCDADVGGAMATVNHDYPEFSIHLMPYLVKIRSGMPVAIEHTQIRWFTMDECVSLDWAEADVPVLRGLLEG
ncbi:MAG: (deoxy)nucleoside triphosphate pyrophosphohydrolase [Verrucomicrobiae bacterium]|nr:(deoxy)nucleoside triphosphate pyrophosphohydrolase [Verrucomicrobiae bacterium]NNJ42332.1 (deoxy)nucleoside triphosphate pyrophosphohydrolase [Akkermansiaceae bacterium]